MLSSQDISEKLKALSSLSSKRHFLEQYLPILAPHTIEELTNYLKEEVIRFLRIDSQLAAEYAELAVQVGQLTHQLAYHALGLRLQAMVLAIGQGRYTESLDRYDQALASYEVLNDPVNQALVHLSRVWAAAQVGEPYEKILHDARQSIQVLETNHLWRDAATLHNNFGAVQRQAGRFAEALDSFQKARAAYMALGEAGTSFLANNANNIAFAYYTLGQFNASIEAGKQALQIAEQLKQLIVLARAQHNLGLSYYALGHYTRALQLFDEAKRVWLREERYHEVAQIELTATYCLLQLRRFHDVLSKCAYVRDLIIHQNVRPETLFSLLNEAKAYGLLGKHSEGLATLATTRQIIAQYQSPWDMAQADFTEATILYLQGNYNQAEVVGQQCVTHLQLLSSPVEVGQVQLLLARIALQRQDFEHARRSAQAVLHLAEASDATSLFYETHVVLGHVDQAQGYADSAFEHYQQALAALEQLQRQTMLEYRADFLADTEKETVYQALIEFSCHSQQVEQAFAFVERMKSRALMDLLMNRIDLRLQARNVHDEALVACFNQLRRERDELHHQLGGGIELSSEIRQELADKQIDCEKELTAIRHQLLVRHADYAHDAALLTVPVPYSPSPYLDGETLLLEFCLIHEQWIVFLISAHSPTQYYPLPATRKEINRSLSFLQVSLQLASQTPYQQIGQLIPNAQARLKELYDGLLAPIVVQLANYRRLIIVPHSALHYVPFQALFDGRQYLIETHAISYLPAASFLHHSRQIRPTSTGLLAIGHSYEGRIPYALAEAQSVSTLYKPSFLFLEGEATISQIQRLAPQFRVLHFATHGEFRADNPLFSGLALADGWLTTLDIFNLQLQASLVTLSACSTGQHVVGGGDELLGLTRAFLAAGAASIAMTHWPVADQDTMQLIKGFYERLLDGARKDTALQLAQRRFLNRADSPWLSHPYFWASFCLIGDAGEL